MNWRSKRSWGRGVLLSTLYPTPDSTASCFTEMARFHIERNITSQLFQLQSIINSLIDIVSNIVFKCNLKCIITKNKP